MVHWDRKLYRKRLVKQILALLLLTAAISSFYIDHYGFAGKESPFVITERFLVPLKEISGADMLGGSRGRTVSMISDRKSEIVRLDLLDGHTQTVNFKDILVEKFSLCRSEDFEECKKLIKKLSSNWEALSTDASGRLFLLQEHTQSIVVLDQTARSILNVLHFNFAEAFPDLIKRGSKKFQTNSLGEGLVLLKNGHILVAKEQYPVALVEFGPEGDVPLGLSPGSVLGPDDAFEVPEGRGLHVNYKPLASWILSGHSKCDVSDLDVDANSRLVVLSQTCRGVAIIDRLDPLSKALVVSYLSLPDEVVDPEALVLDGDKWLIASDVSSKRQNNFYILRLKDSL